MNILNYSGHITEDDRKQPLVRGCEWFTFSTCLDLSEPIKMTPYHCSSGKVCLRNYSSDIASFISWWTIFVHKDLNGFRGLHSVKFELVDCEIV